MGWREARGLAARGRWEEHGDCSGRTTQAGPSAPSGFRPQACIRAAAALSGRFESTLGRWGVRAGYKPRCPCRRPGPGVAAGSRLVLGRYRRRRATGRPPPFRPRVRESPDPLRALPRYVPRATLPGGYLARRLDARRCPPRPARRLFSYRSRRALPWCQGADDGQAERQVPCSSRACKSKRTALHVCAARWVAQHSTYVHTYICTYSIRLATPVARPSAAHCMALPG